MMPTRLRLAMRLSPLEEMERADRQNEIDAGQHPQPAPIARNLPQARAQLIDADDAVDRKVRREYRSCRERGLWDCFPRPGKSREEQLRNARPEEDERRALRVFEPGTRRLSREARRKN